MDLEKRFWKRTKIISGLIVAAYWLGGAFGCANNEIYGERKAVQNYSIRENASVEGLERSILNHK